MGNNASLGPTRGVLVNMTATLGNSIGVLGKTTATLGKTTVTLGKTTATLGKTTVTLGKTTVTLGKSQNPKGQVQLTWFEGQQAPLTPFRAAQKINKTLKDLRRVRQDLEKACGVLEYELNRLANLGR